MHQVHDSDEPDKMTNSATASECATGSSDPLSRTDSVLGSREKRRPGDKAMSSMLLQLPLEIREVIYENVVCSSVEDDTYRTLPLRLSELCHQIASETRQLYKLSRISRRVLDHFWSPQQIYTGRDRCLITDHCIPCLVHYFDLTPPWSLFHPFESHHTTWTAQLPSYATKGNEPATVHIEARSMAVELARGTDMTGNPDIEVNPRTIEITLTWKSLSCGFRHSNTLHNIVCDELPVISMQLLDIKSWTCITEYALASVDQGWIRTDIVAVLVDVLTLLSGIIYGAVGHREQSMAGAVCNAFAVAWHHMDPDCPGLAPAVVRKWHRFPYA